MHPTQAKGSAREGLGGERRGELPYGGKVGTGAPWEDVAIGPRITPRTRSPVKIHPPTYQRREMRTGGPPSTVPDPSGC